MRSTLPEYISKIPLDQELKTEEKKVVKTVTSKEEEKKEKREDDKKEKKEKAKLRVSALDFPCILRTTNSCGFV